MDVQACNAARLTFRCAAWAVLPHVVSLDSKVLSLLSETVTVREVCHDEKLRP